MQNKNQPHNPSGGEAKKAPGQDFPGKPAEVYAQQKAGNPGQRQAQGRPLESYEQEPQRDRDPSIAGKPQAQAGQANKPGQGAQAGREKETAKR